MQKQVHTHEEVSRSIPLRLPATSHTDARKRRDEFEFSPSAFVDPAKTRRRNNKCLQKPWHFIKTEIRPRRRRSHRAFQLDTRRKVNQEKSFSQRGRCEGAAQQPSLRLRRDQKTLRMETAHFLVPLNSWTLGMHHIGPPYRYRPDENIWPISLSW